MEPLRLPKLRLCQNCDEQRPVENGDETMCRECRERLMARQMREERLWKDDD